MDKDSTHHLTRIRTICAALPETTERPSHGEPSRWRGGWWRRGG